MNFSPPRQPARPAPAITVIGDIGIDLVMGPLNAWPEMGTETLVPQSEMRPGGSAGNAALALRALGAPTRLISATGNDALGHWLRDQFGGIDAELAELAAATSLSVGVLHANDRSFLTTRGHLELQTWNATAAIDGVALLTGVFLLPQMRRHYGALLTELRDAGYTIAIDTGWPSEGFTSDVRAEVMDWLGQADHILLNELEITRVAGTENLDAAMDMVAQGLRPNATLVAKLGKAGAIARRGRDRAQASPPAAGNIFDTIGAGDAFNAGYLHALTQGATLETALTHGCDTATRTIAHFPRQGAQTWPTKA